MPNQRAHHDNYGTRSASSWREPQTQSSSGVVATDEAYGLVSVLYHALKAQRRTRSAWSADEAALVEFFSECQQ